MLCTLKKRFTILSEHECENLSDCLEILSSLCRNRKYEGKYSDLCEILKVFLGFASDFADLR